MKTANDDARIKKVMCPHCGAEITNVQWRFYGEKGEAVLMACGLCLKVIGSSLRQDINITAQKTDGQ